MAPPGQFVIGAAPVPRPTCAGDQIKASAATRRTIGGVLGVVHLLGTVVMHAHGVPLRCALPVNRGPSALLAARGERIPVPLSSGDSTDPPENPRSDLALNDGDAVWGFAWFGSRCGAPARAVRLPLHPARRGWLRVPLHGPQPHCNHTDASVLIDGAAGRPGQPVQPARPAFSRLRLTGHIEPGTTSRRLAPIDLTLRATGAAAVVLDPCPYYAGRDSATAHSGGFSDPIGSGHLPCTSRVVVLRPGHPLHWTISDTSLVQTPGTGAIPGSTVYVSVGIAGVPQLQLKTTAR